MHEVVQMQVGHYALSWQSGFQPWDQDVAGWIRAILDQKSEWSARHVSDLFEISLIQRVDDNTYDSGPTMLSPGGRRMVPRMAVIATSISPDALEWVRDRLFAMGQAADDAIDAELRRVAKIHMQDLATTGQRARLSELQKSGLSHFRLQK